MQLRTVADDHAEIHGDLFLANFDLDAFRHAFLRVQHTGNAFHNAAGHAHHALNFRSRKACDGRDHIRSKENLAALGRVYFSGDLVIRSHMHYLLLNLDLLYQIFPSVHSFDAAKRLSSQKIFF